MELVSGNAELDVEVVAHSGISDLKGALFGVKH